MCLCIHGWCVQIQSNILIKSMPVVFALFAFFFSGAPVGWHGGLRCPMSEVFIASAACKVLLLNLKLCFFFVC